MSFGGGQGTLGLLPVFDQGQDGSCLRSEPCWGMRGGLERASQIIVEQIRKFQSDAHVS